MNKTDFSSINIQNVIKELTLEEKASLMSGLDFWHTKAVERLGIPQIMVADGPHGLRKQETGSDGKPITVKATCFPSASALSCSWDTDLCREVGSAIGEECLENEVDILLGPGINIKRSPLCGRNFEYYSEDPFLAGHMAAGFIQGVQSQGIGTSLKHFAVNNQEWRRLCIDACLSERALMEIYLANFEIAVKQAKPWTVMCSYNRINGEYACESKMLLTHILRELWKHEGIVVSDWGATNDRVKCLQAGMELEMPASGGLNDAKIIHAVKNGQLDIAVLDTAVERLLKIIQKAVKGRKEGYIYNRQTHQDLARKAASESAVLLKNENNILPVKKEESLCVVGAFAKQARFQGGGSSHVNATVIINAYDEIARLHTGRVVYQPGYSLTGEEADAELITQAVEQAKQCDKVVIFAGLPDSMESEGYDRSHLELPASHNALICAIARECKNTAVILFNGSAVTMPWIKQVGAVLECYLGGQMVGAAAAEIVLGKANPCGKLSESFPEKLSHTPCCLSFPGEGDKTLYQEDIFVGYRYYDIKQISPLFPFGHGLSYTSFSYSGLQMRKTGPTAAEVVLKIKNTGQIAGKEVVQLYVKENIPCVKRPVKELKGFQKVFLQPGEEKEVSFILDKRTFAFYSPEEQNWVVNTGTYEILIGSSSRDIRLSENIEITSEYKPKQYFHRNSTISDVIQLSRGKQWFEETEQNRPEIFDSVFNGMDDDGTAFKEEMLLNTTLRSLVYFSRGMFSEETMDQLIGDLNRQ